MAFNTFIDRRSTNIHVEQKPHDAADAARLYGELKNKADAELKEIIFSKLEPLGLELVMYQKNLSPASMNETHWIAFKINDQRFNVCVTEDEYSKVKSGSVGSFLKDHFLPRLAMALTIEIDRKEPKWLIG